MVTHYAVSINEENFALIAFLNGGKLLDEVVKKANSSKMYYFCFSIKDGKIVVLKNPVREYYSLWVDEHKVKNDRKFV